MAEQETWDQGSEGQQMDRKSLRKVSGKTADFPELAQDCVAFANASGGRLLIGIEDGESEPPADQQINPELLDRLRKRMGELTVNLTVVPEILARPNGGECIVLSVLRATGVASTSDGRYFVRIGDASCPVVGDDVLRLATERPGVPWETLTSLNVPAAQVDREKWGRLCAALRASDRVKSSVKEKNDDELMAHYGLTQGEVLTNLGVLLIGTRADRARLGTAPVVQAIRYDERGVKIGKFPWDDHALSPVELLDAIWQEIPDFRESYELPEGMFRTTVPAYEESVIRELLVNALVHRPYTQRGDVFINLHPDRLEIVNAGRLPLGVTPQNILHASRRRNDGLARMFHDLKLMEREGSGFDLVYDRLLASGRAVPVVTEGIDSVHVVIPRRVIHPGVIRLIGEADQRFQLTQRERITLGLLGQSEGLQAADLMKALEVEDPDALQPWISRLIRFGLVAQSGRTRSTRYFVLPDLLRHAGLDSQTTLIRIQPHRLRALILEDLERFPNSGRVDIQRRIGSEIHPKAVSRALGELVEEGEALAAGEKRWRTYRLAPSHGQKP